MCCGKLSLSQVSNRLQYATVQSFSKAFKRTMGCSPTAFLRQRESQMGIGADGTAADLPIPNMITDTEISESRE